MKNTKTQFRWFTIMEYDKEQDYLGQMHAKGWKLTHVTLPGFYHFEQCEPEEVVYQLDYNQEGLTVKSDYIRMFEDCGWEYLFDWVGYSYFRKPKSQMKGEESIFCDDNSRAEMMRRVLRGRLIPLILLFLGVVIPQLFMQWSLHGLQNPLFITYCILFVGYTALFIQLAVQYWLYKQRIQ